MKNNENTMYFEFPKDKKTKTEAILREVYEALTEKGYNPISQLVGYLMSGDPSYITSYKGARGKIAILERDDILEEVLRSYLKL